MLRTQPLDLHAPEWAALGLDLGPSLHEARACSHHPFDHVPAHTFWRPSVIGAGSRIELEIEACTLLLESSFLSTHRTHYPIVLETE
jgi:hypothetical protein